MFTRFSNRKKNKGGPAIGLVRVKKAPGREAITMPPGFLGQLVWNQ
jgi:hypothetical protein